MAALTATNQPVRHILGDMCITHWDLSGNNGDTFTFPANQVVVQVDAAPTTAINIGCTRSNNVITFVTAGAWAARVTVWTKNG